MSNSSSKIVRTTTWSAGPGCHGGCGVLAHIKDGKLVKIEGDPRPPLEPGAIVRPGTGDDPVCGKPRQASKAAATSRSARGR